MAGNKINTKKKEDKNKSNRGANQAVVEEHEDIDFSLLRKPILTSITGFAQARKIFDQATEELKSLLTNECDLLYECKVCRNIFRSLANFISHKRVYCKEKFNSSVHGHFIKETCTIQEVLKIRKLEESYQESLAESNSIKLLEEDEVEERIPMSKDLTEVLEKIVKSKGVQDKKIEEQKLTFQKIPKSSVAVFQNIESNNSSSDSMRTQVKELDHILSQEKAVLQSDGTFEVQSNNVSTDNVIQISDDDENDTDTLKCKICQLQFSTLKTLKFHMKYKHVESRLVYPCPECIDIFSTSWSVYRHLFKVHRKTAAQIRRLRESIQAKAFRMDNPPAFYEKRKTVPKVVPPQKITEEERLDQENQAWLEELDGEGEGRRCVCGRTFERRAALAAHAHTCARRHRRRIGIQIRKDYHKEQTNPYLAATRPQPADPKRVSPVVENVQPEKKSNDIKNEEKNEDNTGLVEAEMTILDDLNEVEEHKDKKEQEKEKHIKEEEEDKDMSDVTVTEPEPFFFDGMLMNKLPFARQAEKSNLNAFKQKLLPDIERDQLMCKKCNTKFNEMNELLDHMAAHYKWMRYACKLCNFKHFNFEKLPEHVKIIHKLKGDSDFYYSTVKAVDGTEALELADTTDDTNESSEVSPDSRRPSRCSSDSSRLSDDSSSSSVRVEAGSRKRKANKYRNNAKKKKEASVIDDADNKEESKKRKDVIVIENDSSSTPKLFEENSSDFDEVDEKITKRHSIETSSVASRRPVRKKTKPKNEDFEYDLSNLLKMDSQGYRDTPTVTTLKSNYYRRRSPQEILQHYEAINKDCCGALVSLSWKSAGKSQSTMKTIGVFTAPKESKPSNTFARPMAPKTTKADKISPKKDEKEIKENSPSPVKVSEVSALPSPEINTSTQNKDVSEKIKSEKIDMDVSNKNEDMPVVLNEVVNESKKEIDDKNVDSENINSLETTKPNVNVPVVPIKFRRQSLELITNPLIKKNIKDFTKAGMKTKILVIKPIINRNADVPNNLNTPFKLQTIKLKDPNKSASNEEMKDQVVVVQVPKLDCAINKPVANNSPHIVSPAMSEANCFEVMESEVSKDAMKTNEVDKVKVVPEKTKESSPEQMLCDSELNKEVDEAIVDLQKTIDLDG